MGKSLALGAMLLAMLGGSSPAGAAPWQVSGDTLLLAGEGRTLPISLRAPSLRLEGGQVVGGVTPERVDAGGDELAVHYSPLELGGGGSLVVELHVRWYEPEAVLRKWARLRLEGGPRLLEEVVLEQWGPEVVREGPGPGLQSYPVFPPGFFAGIEFPVATTRREGERVLLAHRPGVRLEPGAWYESRRAVYGVAVPGSEQAAFTRYLAGIRVAPAGLHVNYNSWWTSPVPYTEADILGLISAFDRHLYRDQGACLDTFCIDMGWSRLDSLWEIDERLFPRGFTGIAQAAAGMQAHLGLWISPCSGYSGALDNEWAARQGYETFLAPWGEGKTRFACLAGERYRSRFQQRLVEMVTRYGVRHVKLDGYLFECPEAGHGHAPGPLSAEAVAQGLVSVLAAVRQAAPDTWLEATCFGWDPSPWWLAHVSSVIGAYGDDAPAGRVPCPGYRESYTSGRDYYCLQGAAHSPVPLAAQEVLGLVHQTGEPFLNDAVMTVLRGHLFLPLYVNPRYMDGARWRALAQVLGWARGHAGELAETVPLLPADWQGGRCPRFTHDAPMPRQPYGYAHWRPGGGLVVLRNPWLAPAAYQLDLPPTVGRDLAAVSLYPERRDYGQGLAGGERLRVPLAPYETLVLELAPGGKPRLPRGGGEHPVQARVITQEALRVSFGEPKGACGPDWTSLVGEAEEARLVRMETEVAVGSGQAELLVLLEDRQPVAAPFARLQVNGRATPLATINSVTGWMATGLPRPEHWLFLRAPLPRGRSRAALELLVPGTPTVSTWVWATRPGRPTRARGALPAPELVSLDARPLLAPLEVGTVTSPVSHQAKPVERIRGVYLDALEPVSASQGWGTLQRNRSVWEKPMTIAGRSFRRGLGTHAPARLVYALGGKYRRFQCWAGADGATGPTITFAVRVDGKVRWQSGLVTRDQPARWVDLEVTRARTLELVVGDGGNGIAADHADWAEARLLR